MRKEFFDMPASKTQCISKMKQCIQTSKMGLFHPWISQAGSLGNGLKEYFSSFTTMKQVVLFFKMVLFLPFTHQMGGLMIVRNKQVFSLFLLFITSSMYAETMRHPVDGSKIVTDCHFNEYCITKGSTNKSHAGVDYSKYNGTNIYAAASGKIVFATLGNNHGFGNAIIIEHVTTAKSKLYTLYGHFASFESFVTVGAIVSKGDKIGTMGNTGHADGVHLHFEIKTKAVLENPSGGGQYWGYMPTDASKYGFYDPVKIIDNTNVDIIPAYDLELRSDIYNDPNNIKTNQSISGSIKINNFGLYNWKGDVYLAIHKSNGTFIRDLASKKNITINASGSYTWTYTEKITESSGTYQLILKYKSDGSSNYPSISQGIYKNPLNIQVGATSSKTTILQDDFTNKYQSWWTFYGGTWAGIFNRLQQADKKATAYATSPKVSLNGYQKIIIEAECEMDYSYKNDGMLYIYFPGGYLYLDDDDNELKIRGSKSYYYSFSPKENTKYFFTITVDPSNINVNINGKSYTVPTGSWSDDVVEFKTKNSRWYFDDFKVIGEKPSFNKRSIDPVDIPETPLRITDEDLIADPAPLNIKVYPNPCVDIVTFEIPHLFDSINYSINITNIQGQVIARLEVDAGEDFVEWDASGVPSGVYFYSFIAEDKIIGVGKCIKSQ